MLDTVAGLTFDEENGRYCASTELLVASAVCLYRVPPPFVELRVLSGTVDVGFLLEVRPFRVHGKKCSLANGAFASRPFTKEDCVVAVGVDEQGVCWTNGLIIERGDVISKLVVKKLFLVLELSGGAVFELRFDSTCHRKFLQERMPRIPCDATRTSINSLPKDIVRLIAASAMHLSLPDAMSLRLTCSWFRDAIDWAVDGWKELYHARWSLANKDMKMQSWSVMYRRRAKLAKIAGVDIENCGMSFVCPLKWSELEPTEQRAERFCSQCNERVYYVTTKEALQNFASQGKCVSYEEIKTQRKLMGRKCF